MQYHRMSQQPDLQDEGPAILQHTSAAVYLYLYS